MSHLLESYSLQTGAKIGKPFIVKNFYPVPEKYITIHNSSGMGAKNYDYFQEVIEEVLPALLENNIHVVQIGTSEDHPLSGCIHLQGKTTYHQTAYIIENSLLHIGNDSFPVHLASASDIPIIALYSITLPNIAGPVFNSKKVLDESVFCFTPDYNGKKPSFNPNESPKTVNTIRFENIIEAIYKVLHIKNEQKIKTLFVGEKFKEKRVELIPDNVVRNDFLPGAPILMRVDLLSDEVNENIIFANLSNRSFYIHVSENKKIENFEALNFYKKNIIEFIIDVTKHKPSKKYIESILSIGLKPIIYYSGNDSVYFDEIKIDLIDLNLRFVFDKKNQKEIDKIIKMMQDQNIEDIYLKTNKVLLKDGKVFLSKEHLIKNIPTDNQKQKISSNLDFENLLLEKDFFFIYSKK